MNLLKSISVYTISNISRQAVGFALIPVITTYLSVSENGELSMLTATITMLGPIIYFSAHSAVNLEYFRSDFGKSNFSKYVSASLVNPILATLLLTFLFTLIGNQLEGWLEIKRKWIIAIPLLCFLNVIPYFISTLYQAEKKPFHHAAYNILFTVIDLVLSIVLIVSFSFGWEGRVLGMLWSKLFFTVVGFYLIYRSGFFSRHIKKEYVENAFYFGLPLIPHIVATGVMDFSDRIFLGKMMGKEELGIYDIGYKIGSIILILQASLMMAWIPFLFEKLKNITERSKIYIISVSYLIMLGLLVSGLLLTLVAPFIYQWFIGPEYAEGVKYVFWIAMAYVFLGFYKMFSSYIIYKKKNSLLSYIALFNIIVNALLNYFLIQYCGTIGAAYATLISYFLFFVITAYFSHKLFPLPWFQFGEVFSFIKQKITSGDFLE